MSKKENYTYYTIWVGKMTGAFQGDFYQIEDYVKKSPGAKFKGFYTLEEAEKAFAMGYDEFMKAKAKDSELPPLW